MASRQIDKQLILRVCLFLLLAVGLNLLFRIPNPVLDSAWYLVVATTKVSVWIIGLVGIKTHVVRNTIGLSNRTLLINLECTAIYLMILFASFVIVYPASWPRKMLGLALGIPSIFVANIIRLLLTSCVAEYKPQFFTYFHDYMWQVGFILLVVVLWVLWIEKIVGYERKTPISP